MKTLITSLAILLPFLSFSQTGPYGIGDNSTNRFWYDANEISSSNGSAISNWNNLGGNSTDATQGTSSKRPLFQSAILNGKGALLFDGSDDEFQIANNSDMNSTSSAISTRTIVIAFTTGTDINSRQILFEEGGSTRGLNLYIYNGEVYVAAWNTANNGTGSPWSFSYQKATISSNTDYILTMTLDGNSSITGSLKMHLNETLVGTTNNIGLLYNHGNGNGLGGVFGNSLYESTSSTSGNLAFDGYIHEFLLFTNALNEAQRIILHNGLSAKYGLTLSTNDVYTMDDNGSGDFDNEVAGIGQLTSSSSHDDAQGTGIVRILNPTGLDDGEFLIWGHDNEELTLSSFSNLPSGITSKLSREWRVSEVDQTLTVVDVGNVDVYIDGSDLTGFTLSDLRLIVDSDNDGEYSDETPIAGSVVGSEIRFTGISDIQNQSRFTLGSISYVPDLTGNNGPGGVGSTDGTSSLELWLNPNVGISTSGSVVTAWSDQSGHGHHVSTVGGNPTVTSTINGSDVVSLDGNDHFENNITSNTGDEVSVYLATTVTGYSGSWASLMSAGEDGENDFDSEDRAVFFLRQSTTDNVFSYRDGYLSGFSNGLSGSNFKIFGTDIDGANNTMRLDGTNATSVSTSNSFDYDLLSIGKRINASRYYIGNLGEVIYFTQSLNEAQKLIIENYLQAKFNGTLSTSSDIYTMDNSGNGDYDFDVAGIGRVDASNLHEEAQGTGDVLINNSGDLDDDEFLIWGHDNGTALLIEAADVPSGVESRLERTWRVSESNSSGGSVDVGAIDLYIDVSEMDIQNISDIVLLVDTDNDGLFNDETGITGGAVSNHVVFQNITAIQDEFRFTLGSVSEGLITWDGTEFKGGSGPSFAPNSTDGAKRFKVFGTNGIISSDAAVKSLIVTNAGQLTINTGVTLVINGGITNDASLVIENGGSLIQTHAGTNSNSGSGDYTIRVSGNNDPAVYNIWSSPIQSADIMSIFTGNPCDVYAFDGPTQSWRYDYSLGSSVTCNGNTFSISSTDNFSGADGVMDISRGYFAPGNSTNTREFNGQINNGDITIPIITTSLGNNPNWDNDDWNLLGNPYPSSISAYAFWTENASITDALYFWDAADSAGGFHQYNDYASWNLLGGVNSGNSAKTPNGHIGVGQGFWFYSTTSTNATFTNAMRTDTSAIFFEPNDLANWFKTWVGIESPTGYQNNILVGYNPGSTNGFDSDFDAHKLIGNNHIRLASRIGQEEFVIQGIKPLLDTEKYTVPLSIFTDEDGVHTFSEFKRETGADHIAVFLHDKEKGIIHDLTSGSYQVTLNANQTYLNRFVLILLNQSGSNLGTDDTIPLATGINDQVYSQFETIIQRDLITIKHQSGFTGTVQIVDVTGKLITTKNVTTLTKELNISTSGISFGVYFIQVIENGTRTYGRKLVR